MNIFECENKYNCRIRREGGSSTLLGYIPIYNGYGEEVSVDPNTFTFYAHCETCGNKWKVLKSGGEETWERLND